jgi:uracil-DNA glycosylase
MEVMLTTSEVDQIQADVVNCRACPRLVKWREKIALEKRSAFRHDIYWGKAVPGFGDESAQILIVGLAPGAHGANRTGRMFTGDRSGDWLYGALHRAGLANQPNSDRIDDGLLLNNVYISAAVHCAPPDNKPTPAERDRCSPFLARELKALTEVKVIIALGNFAYESLWRQLSLQNLLLPKPRPKFSHGLEILLPKIILLSSYHPSQQNTFTGRLTEPMFDKIFSRALDLVNK